MQIKAAEGDEHIALNKGEKLSASSLSILANYFGSISGKGGTPPPPLTESPLSFSGKFVPKRAKNVVFFIK